MVDKADKSAHNEDDMPKRSSKEETPEDQNELAAFIVEEVTKEDTSFTEEQEEQGKGKNPNAVALGRLGGLKGGRARADKLTARQKSEIARKAAQARWGESKDKA